MKIVDRDIIKKKLVSLEALTYNALPMMLMLEFSYIMDV